MAWLDMHRRKQGSDMKSALAITNVNFANRNFNDSLSHIKVQIEDEYYDARFIIKREYNTSSKVETEMLIFRPFTEVFRGQLAEFRKHKWLIFFVDTGELAPKVYIRMCNKTLKFDNGNQYDCVVDTNIREYQSIKDLNRLNLMSDIMKVMVASNDDTWEIRETDRFIFDGMAWEVQGVDKVAYTTNKSGIVEFVVKKVPLSLEEKDEIETESIPESDYHMKIIGDDEVAVDDEVDFTTELYRDGMLVDSSTYTVVWSVDNGHIASDGRYQAPSNEGKANIVATYQYANNQQQYETIEIKKQINIFTESWGWG